MDVKNMKYIVTIAEEQNLSRAAKKLKISQPTLSAFLANLEESLGTDLFIREKKKLIPTEAGQIYLFGAVRIISIHDQTYATIRRMHHSEKKTLRIAGTQYRGAELFAAAFSDFTRKFPDVQLELIECESSDIRNAVRSDKADIGINTLLNQDYDEFKCINHSREEIILGIPPFYPIVEKKYRREISNTITLKEINDAAFVLAPEGTNLRYMIDERFREENIKPTILYETNNHSAIRSMVNQGGGVGLYARHFIRSKDKQAIFSLNPPLYMDLGIILKKDHEVTKEIRYLSWLIAQINMREACYLEPINNEEYEAIKAEFSNDLTYLSMKGVD